jgi:hypothetical protein
MLIAAIVFFSLAAILGMTLLTFVLRTKPTSKALLFAHGGMAATGLLLLIIYTYRTTAPSPIESVVLFVIAAMGGGIMGARDLMGKSVPKWLAIVHGLVAVTGFAYLLFYAFAN